MVARRSVVRDIWVLFVAAFLSALGSPAHAQTSAENRAAAEALFSEAGQAFKEGKYELACGKLARSQELDPAVGTLLNLARCYEKIGKTASAWSTFVEAASAAKAARQSDREETARAQAARLEPLLPRLLIEVSDTVNVEGLTIRRNRESVPKAVWNVSSPIDPGTHAIEVSAPGKRPWSTSVELEASRQATVAVPPLVDAPSEGPAPEATAAESSSLGTQRIIAIAVAGAGVLSVGAGSYFGLSAMSEAKTANDECEGEKCFSQEALDANERGLDHAMLSTIFFSAGAALVAGGAVLWFTAPSGEATKRGGTVRPGIAGVSPLVLGGTRGLLVEGRF